MPLIHTSTDSWGDKLQVTDYQLSEQFCFEIIYTDTRESKVVDLSYEDARRLIAELTAALPEEA